jgi:hypothetical protein
MKIKITEKQLKQILIEQVDALEKSLSILDYQFDKPFSCVQYEPIDINGKNIFPKNYAKKVQYKVSELNGAEKYGINLTFWKEWKGTPKNVVVIHLGGEDDGKRFQQLEYAGDFACNGRSIEIDLDTQIYYQADETNSFKDADREKQNTEFYNNPFSGEIPLKKYSSLDALGTEISKIKFDHTQLNPII